MTITTQSTNKQMDTFARLLANENITIERANVSTARFNLKDRILTLPTWKDMDSTTEQMLILHEVGHALATDLDECKEIFGGELTHLRSYFNIIEDARIERLIKSKYPGSKKVFFEGYKNLLDKDFFGLRDRDLDRMIFADRMNIHFKCGSLVDVKFSEEEMIFIRRVEAASSMSEVMEIAEDVYEYCKQEKLNHLDDLHFNDFDFGDDDDDFDDQSDDDEENNDVDITTGAEESDDDIDEDDERQTVAGPGGSGEQDEDVQPVTDSIFSRRLEDQCDVDSKYQYFVPEFENFYEKYQNIIPFTRVLEDFRGSWRLVEWIEANKGSYSKFSHGTNLTVSYLVKEFEMKKAASSYRRQQQAKTGSIDTRKLFQYQLNDDIFRQMTVVKNEKRHSMTFLLDWSGSMHNCMQETIQQLIGLVSFCKRINIPFNVFAFSDAFGDHSRELEASLKKTPNGLMRNNNFALIELFSDKMKNHEFSTMCEALYSNPWNSVDHYHLNGTPLNAALIYSVDYLGKFLRSTGTEKNTFILLTDGDGEGVQNSTMRPLTGRYRDFTSGKNVNYKSYLRDPVTKLEYPIWQDDSINVTNSLLDIIRTRYGVKVIRFFVTPASVGQIRRFMDHNSVSQSVINEVETLTKKFRKDNYLQIDGIAGVDKMFLIKSNTKVSDGELEVDENMNARQLSAQLKNSLQTSRTSRVLLSRFIDEIA